MRVYPFVGFLLLSLVWGSEWMLAASLPPQPILLSLAIRCALAALILLPWALRAHLWRAVFRSVMHAAILGICILCLPQILIVLGDKELPPGLSLLALAAVPVLLAVSGKGAITTAVCGLAGVLFLTGSGLSVSLHQAPWLLLPISAAIVLAWGLSRAEKDTSEVTPAGSLFIQCTVAALLFAGASRLFERQPVEWTPSVAVGIAVTVVVTTVCGYLFFYWLLARLGAAKLSVLQWTQTLVATIESAALMRIRPGWESVIGAILIVIAVIQAFSYRDEGPGVILQITQA